MGIMAPTCGDGQTCPGYSIGAALIVPADGRQNRPARSAPEKEVRLNRQLQSPPTRDADGEPARQSGDQRLRCWRVDLRRTLWNPPRPTPLHRHPHHEDRLYLPPEYVPLCRTQTVWPSPELRALASTPRCHQRRTARRSIYPGTTAQPRTRGLSCRGLRRSRSYGMSCGDGLGRATAGQRPSWNVVVRLPLCCSQRCPAHQITAGCPHGWRAWAEPARQAPTRAPQYLGSEVEAAEQIVQIECAHCGTCQPV
jgi:hypothetical protein